MLNGATIMETACLYGKAATVLVFRRLLRTPKWIHITEAFEREFPGVTQVFKSVLKLQPKPKLWKILSLEDIWARAFGTFFFFMPAQGQAEDELCAVEVPMPHWLCGVG